MAAKKSKAKPAKKAAKKAAKKVTKKAAKKASKKTVVKKAMKKTAPKKVAKKVIAKPAKKAAKKVAKKVTKKAAPAKKAAPKKADPVKKAAPAKKAAPVKKAAPAKKSAPVKAAAPAKKAAPVKKVAPTKKEAPKKTLAELEEEAPKIVKTTHNAAFIKKQRQRLLDLRDELVDAMTGMTRDTIRNAPEGSEASGSGQHQGDAGSDAYDRDFALSVLAKEQDALYEIEQALRRIDQGTYGMCEISYEKIPTLRLEAIPFARLTVTCQAQWEQEYGNRRFRPSNEVGFSGGNQLDDEDSASVSLDDDD